MGRQTKQLLRSLVQQISELEQRLTDKLILSDNKLELRMGNNIVAYELKRK